MMKRNKYNIDERRSLICIEGLSYTNIHFGILKNNLKLVDMV